MFNHSYEKSKKYFHIEFAFRLQVDVENSLKQIKFKAGKESEATLHEVNLKIPTTTRLGAIPK